MLNNNRSVEPVALRSLFADDPFRSAIPFYQIPFLKSTALDASRFTNITRITFFQQAADRTRFARARAYVGRICLLITYSLNFIFYYLACKARYTDVSVVYAYVRDNTTSH
jgi:hypothetical protein